MLRKVMLPLDESELSESAIPFTVDLISRCAAEALLVEVTPHFIGEAPGLLPMTGLEMQQEQLVQARKYLESRSGRLAPNAVSIHTPLGRPRDEICNLAFEQGCDLIVMASHGRDNVPRWLLGSVAEGVIRQARCPVLLLRPPVAERSLFRNILVPTDGSDASIAFLPDLQSFLDPNGTITLLLSAGTSLSPYFRGMEKHFEQIESRLRQLQWNEQPFPVVVLKGDPVHDILSWTEEHQCDLIAMSTHGRSGFRRFWLGSVTEKVARHAPCPVLVFPHFRPIEDEA